MSPPDRVVHWRSLATGAGGHGDPLPASLAIAIADEANAAYEYIVHWTEVAPPLPVVALVNGVVTIGPRVST